MNQPRGYLHRLPLEPPSHLPPSHPLGHLRAWAKFPVSHSGFPVALCFICGSVCFSAPLSSQFVPSSSFPHVLKSIFYVWDNDPQLSSVQFTRVAQSCLTLCDPMNHSPPGLPVHHKLLEFTQTHVHWVGDAIQPTHPLLSLSPPALNLSQHQGLFKN